MKRSFALFAVALLGLFAIGCGGSSGYAVSYDANGATGGTAPKDAALYKANATVTVLDNTGSLVKTGYSFSGWNTAADGKGTTYAAGATFAMGSADATLYALWTAVPTYSVTYDANGATSGTAPVDSGSYAAGAAVTVLDNTGSLAKTGYVFSGWNTAANGSGTAYAAKATLSMGSAKLTLYAVWKATHKVTYDGNGSTSGTAPSDGAVYLSGATVTVLGNTGSLLKTNYVFNGWNTASDGSGTSYAKDSTFAMGGADVALYALWKPTTGVTVAAPTEVTVSLTLGSSTVSAGSAITATAAASASVDSYAWYLDGSVVSGQTTASFSGGTSMGAGPHTLMVVVRKNSIAYSASGCVTVQ